jgi:hypothetical protein
MFRGDHALSHYQSGFTHAQIVGSLIFLVGLALFLWTKANAPAIEVHANDSGSEKTNV